METNTSTSHTIECPQCGTKQTVFERISQGFIPMIRALNRKGESYIKCAFVPCQHVFTGADLRSLLTDHKF
jgi:hypothetical protein